MRQGSLLDFIRIFPPNQRTGVFGKVFENTVSRCHFITDTSTRVELVELYYENGRSVTQCLRAFRKAHGRYAAPSETTVRALVKKFKETGSVHDVPRSGRPRTARTEENVNAVAADVAANPTTSTRHRAQQLSSTEL